MSGSEYLFVYGTLLPELAPAGMQKIVRQLEFINAGCVGGRLYDLGEYPGAVIDTASESVIIGKLFRLPEPMEVLARLDEYEGFDQASPDDSLFRRVSGEVTLAGARKIAGWIYVLNRCRTDAVLIPDGNYLNWLASKRGYKMTDD